VADVINENAPGNCQLTSHEIQQDISQACAEETTKIIMSELGNAGFSLLVDESRDASVKEQMAVMIRLVVCYYKFVIQLLCSHNSHNYDDQVCEQKRSGFGKIAWC
jgi:hypothetical protein